jgi:DNA-damage-inducible protein D
VDKQDILSPHKTIFEQIKRFDKKMNEYWSARDLAKILEYSEYRHFLPVLEKAKLACVNSGQQISDHFEDMLDMVKLGSGSERSLPTCKLSRYACYLLIQNADPSKEIVALGQTYFAFQTRKQELAETPTLPSNDVNNEDGQRLLLREEMRQHNKQLSATAKKAGVESPIDFAIFQDEGYKGLYGGLTQKRIHSLKQLKKSQKILDHMGSTELAANLFRATQTEDKIRRENIKGKYAANDVHLEVGKTIRQTIKDLGGTMPEHLPVAESIKSIERKHSTDKTLKSAPINEQ